MMRTIVVLMLLPAALSAQQRVDRRWAIDPEASIRITMGAGRVRILGWDRDTVQVTGEIAPGAGTFYGGGRGNASKLGVEPLGDGSGPGATFEVRVPRRARVWVKTVSAGIEVSDLEGEVDLTSVSGAERVSGPLRVVTAETMDGAITVEGAGHGVMRLRTGDGRIAVRAGGGDLTAVSVGGDIDVQSPRLDRARLESVSGTVAFAGNLAPAATLELESHSGDVLVTFEGAVNAEFDLTSVTGIVHNQLSRGAEPLKGKPLQFTVGSGGAQVVIRSFKGTVTVRR
jgi:hypothetical protein